MGRTAHRAPVGVKIICVLAALGTIVGLLGGLGMMSATSSPRVPAWFGLLGMVTVVLALVNLPMIYGLWTVKEWGWTLAMVVYGLNVLLNLLSLLAGQLGSIVSLVIGLAILAYLFSKRGVYGKSVGGPGASLSSGGRGPGGPGRR